MHAIRDGNVDGIDAGLAEQLFIRPIRLGYVEPLRSLLCFIQVSRRDGRHDDAAVRPSRVDDGGLVDSGRREDAKAESILRLGNLASL